jgi:hypothetical protein
MQDRHRADGRGDDNGYARGRRLDRDRRDRPLGGATGRQTGRAPAAAVRGPGTGELG